SFVGGLPEMRSDFVQGMEVAVLVCSDLPPSSTRSKSQILSGILISAVLRRNRLFVQFRSTGHRF
ncbi:MAG: hypothetical protein AAB946_00810, partial [Patescibacteria group bacterium]